jgi:hypothetical protein
MYRPVMTCNNPSLQQIVWNQLYAEAAELTDYSYDNPNPVPLLYQRGCLTISGYDKKYRSYQLNYPNDEVRYGFLKSLFPLLLNDVGSAETLDIRAFGNDIETGNTDNLKNRFTALFARLPYPGDERVIEQSFQNVVYIVFMLLGQYTLTEVHSSRGRADCVVETKKFVYIFVFKRDKSAREVLRQIDERGYAKPYSSDKRVLIKIGVNFSSVERNVSEWEVEMQGGAG